MNFSRRSFLGAMGAAGAMAAVPGCCCFKCGCKKAQVALQLYSIRTYIGGKKDKSGKETKKGVGLAQALKDVAAVGYKGVEFAGYYGHKPEELKAMLADAKPIGGEGQHATFAVVNKSIPRAVWWNHGADVEAIRAHDVPRDVLFTLLESDFGGDPHLELKLLDARPSAPDAKIC